MNSDKIVSELIDACWNGEYPESNECLEAFRFTKCRTIEDCSNLLGLYVDIITIDKKFKKEKMKTAIEENKIIEYILEVSKNYGDSYYITWFNNNIQQFI
jgi:hypothetical protein